MVHGLELTLCLLLGIHTQTTAEKSLTDTALSSAQAPTRSESGGTAKEFQAASQITYTNAQYGFRFFLPKSWNGYTILTWEWDGELDSKSVMGQIIIIRHPDWTKDVPREDIPIMVFTREQWALIKKESLIVSAAPFPPSELGENAKYVFALPPRYNYDFLAGWEEVQKIIDGKPLHGF